MSDLNEMAEAIHKTAQEHGWWEPQCKHESYTTMHSTPVVIWCNDCGAYRFHEWAAANWQLPNNALKRNVGEVLMLVVTEIAEMYEEYRAGHKPNEIYYNRVDTYPEAPVHSDKPEGMPVEAADAIIRLLDYMRHEGVATEAVMRLKMAYNDTRPYRHGGKLS